MTAHWYYESAPDVWTEISDRIGRVDWEVTEQAEEGAAAMSTLVIDDPDGDFDIRGRIYVYCEEDSSEADDNRLYGGIVAEQEIGRAGGEWLNPLGRVWSVSVVDMNTNWARRVMVGADCNRPAETDVERVQWLMTVTETNWATDRTTWISTASPIAMDAVDYRGQSTSQIMDDCAQSSGRNWFTALLRDENGDPQIRVWYGKDSLEVYDSPLSLSNDQADWDDDELADGTSLVWPISMDTKLRRDPSRVYSGVYLPYDGGAVYRMSQDTIDEFSPWDSVMPAENVKSSAKAVARAERYLGELDEQDRVVHTTVELPAAKATMIRAGMRIRFRATHLPTFSSAFVWCRVLTCSIKPVADGSRYQLTLELSPIGVAGTIGWAYNDYALNTPYVVTLPGPPLEGATMLAYYWKGNLAAGAIARPTSISGLTAWTEVAAGNAYDATQYGGPGAPCSMVVYTRVAAAGESAEVLVSPNNQYTGCLIGVITGTLSGGPIEENATMYPDDTRTVTAAADEGDTLIVAWVQQRTTYAYADHVTPGAGVVEMRDAEQHASLVAFKSPHHWVAYSRTLTGSDIVVAGTTPKTYGLNKWAIYSVGLVITSAP